MADSLNAIWNTLEIAKLLVSAVTPILIAVVGLHLNRRLKAFEHRQWRNQKLIEKRLAIYDELAPMLNDLLCYYTFVGNWKEFKPTDILRLKRATDKKLYLVKPLFSPRFFEESMVFINLCFKPYQGVGHNAKLLTSTFGRKKAFGDEWEPSWDDMFADEKVMTDTVKIKESYNRIMKILSEDIGLQQDR